MGVLDDLLPSAAPKAAKPKAGLLDDLIAPASQPQAKGGLLDDLLPERPSLTEGRSFDAHGMQFQVQGGQLVEQTPERRKFYDQRPELLKDAPQQFQLPKGVDLSALPKGRMVSGQEAAKAEGLTKTGYEGKGDTSHLAGDAGGMSTMERIGSRLVTPIIQAFAHPSDGFQPLQEGGSLQDAVQLASELAAPQGEGKFATFEEFAGLQERPGFAQGYAMAPPVTEEERRNREAAVMIANMVNPANPVNLMADLATGGAATGGSRAARAVPREIAAGPLDNLATAAMNSGGRTMAEDFGLARRALTEAQAPVPRQEQGIAGVNFVEPTPPPTPPPPPMPRGDLPEIAPGASLTVPQRFDPLDIMPASQPQRELTLPAVSPQQMDELMRPRVTEFEPAPPVTRETATVQDALPAPASAPEPAPLASIFAREKAPNNIPLSVDRNGRPVRQWMKLTAKERKAWVKQTPEQRAEVFAAKAEQRGGTVNDLAPKPPARAPEAVQPEFTAERPMALPQQGELLKPPPVNLDQQMTLPTMELLDKTPRRAGAGLLDDLLPAPKSQTLPMDTPSPASLSPEVPLPDAPPAGLLDDLLPEAAVPGKKATPLRMSAFGAAELQQLGSMLDQIPVQIYKGITKLSDKAVSAAEKTVIGKKTLRSWRHWMKAGGNAPEELRQMGMQMQDHLSAVGAQIADEIVPVLRGDDRGNFLVRLAPGGKFTTLEQQAVGDVIKGNAPRVPLPAGGAEAAQMAKEVLVRDGLDVLAQTLAIKHSTMADLVQDEIIEIGQLIRGQKSMTESSAKLQAIAQNSIRELESMGALEPPNLNGVRAIKDNLLHERTFFRRAGRYMPRMYAKFEWDQLAQQTLDDLVNLAPPDMSNELRTTLVEAMQPTAHANRGIQNRMKTIIRDRFLRRKDLPPELRQALGEILEPAFPVAKGHYQLRQAIEMQKMTRFIASRPEWVQPEGTVGFFDHATGQPYVKMAADTPEFGVLQGRLVHPDVADYLEMQRLNGSAGEQFWDQAVSAWKFGKVVLNPASHGRNLMSNVMMADLAGMGNNPASWRRHLDAAADYLSQGAWYKEARDSGVLGGTWHEAEIKNLADGLLGPAAAEKQSANWIVRTGEYIKAGARGMGEVAGAEDQLFKLSVYKWARESGMSPADAKQYVKDWMPDYRQNGRLVQVMAGRGQITNRSRMVEKVATVAGKMFASPFVNFTASALPKAAKAAMGIGLRKGEMRALDPSVAFRFWKYPIAAAGITAASAKALGMTSREVEAAQPDYMRSWVPGNYPLMPWRDQHGRLQHLDLSYILPWGDFTKMRFNQDDPTPPPILSSGGPATPFIEALMFNKSLFTGKEVWSPGMTPEQQAARIVDHIYKGLMPSFVPGIPGLTGSEVSMTAALDPQEWKYALARSGGYSSSKLFSSILSIPDYKGRQRALGTTLADVFLGIKIQPVDEAATARSKAFERVQVIRSIKEEIKRVSKDQGWAQAPEVRERFIQGLRERQANIIRGGQVPQGNPLLQDLFDSIFQDKPAPGIQPVVDAGGMG